MLAHSDFYLGLSPMGFHRLHYLSWGTATDKPTTICVHGLSRNARDFDYLAQDLAQDRRIACPDIAGRGKSQRLPFPHLYGYPQYMADLTALMARLQHETFDWIGTSMGGLLGIFLAAQPLTPIRRLVINDVGAQIPVEAIRRIRGYIGLNPRFTTLEQAEKYIRQILSPFGELTDEQWRHLTVHGTYQQDNAYYLAHDPAIVKTFQDNDNNQDIELWSFWEKVKCPVLLIRGANSDVLTPSIAAKMKEIKPDLEYIEIPDTGHAPALMSSDQIHMIREFLG